MNGGQSRTLVPTFLASMTSFMEEFFMDQWRGCGFEMIQVCCVLCFYYYYVVIYDEISIQLTVMQYLQLHPTVRVMA